MQMMMVWQLGYTQSHVLQWMGLFVPQGAIQKPVLAHYPASPSKLQTYTCCLQNTAGTTLNTNTAQFLSITAALLFCAGLTPGQDLLFCVPACCHSAGRSAARKILAGTQQESLPHAESRDWQTVGLTEELLPKPFAATHLSLSADAEEQTGSRGNLEPDFEFPLFFRLCHFPNDFLWKETHRWSLIRASIVLEVLCRATYWGGHKEACQRKRHGIAFSLHEADPWTGTREWDSNSEGMQKSTSKDQVTGGIMYWYEAKSASSHQTKISAGTPRQEPLRWRTRHHIPVRYHMGRNCCII